MEVEMIELVEYKEKGEDDDGMRSFSLHDLLDRNDLMLMKVILLIIE